MTSNAVNAIPQTSPSQPTTSVTQPKKGIAPQDQKAVSSLHQDTVTISAGAKAAQAAYQSISASANKA